MAKISLYLESRGKNPQVKIMISHRSRTALVSTDVFVLASQWDGNNQQVVNNPQSRELNYKLRRLFSNAEMVLMDAQHNGELGRLSCVDIKSRIMEVIDPSFAERKERENRFVARFERVAGNSACTYLAILKAFLVKYIDEKIYPCKNPAKELKAKRVPSEQVVLTTEEINRIERYQPKTEKEK